MDTIVIIGAGHAGVQAADSLRAGGHPGRITLIGAESRFPYQRPPLSKDFMLGEQSDLLPLRGPRFFEENKIDLRLGTAVERISPAHHEVQLDTGEALRYDGLILATGSANRRLGNIPAALSDQVHDLRTADDAIRLRSRLDHARHAVVIGAGFVGLEFAAVARHKGVQVTVIELADRPMARVLSPEMSDVFMQMHAAVGIELRLNDAATGFRSNGQGGYTIQTSSGTSVNADMILCSIGAVPEVHLAAAAGLEVVDGIVVNQQLQTSDPHIWAIGDCVRYPSRFAGGMTRLESVQNAVDQARHVAKTMLGDTSSYDDVPWFWTIQGSSKLQIAGVYKPGDVSVIRAHDTNKCSVFLFREGKLSCVESLNQPGDHVAARKVLASENGPGIELVRQADFDLKQYWKSAKSA